MPHPHQGNSIVGGGGSVVGGDPLDYYLGSAHLANRIAAEQVDNNLLGIQSQTGLGVLGALSQYLGNPTGGPMGLVAASRYGGPQGMASGTDGQGLDTSYEAGWLQRIFESMGEFATGINAEPADAAFVASGGATPAIGNPATQTTPGVGGSTDWEPYLSNLGLAYGGKVKLQNYDDGGVHPVTPAPVPTPQPTPSPTLPAPSAPPTDEQLNVYGGRALIEAARKNQKGGGDVDAFIQQINNIVALQNLVKTGQVSLPSPYNAAPLTRGMGSLPADIIRKLLQENFSVLPYPTLGDPQSPNRPGFADGGGMTLGGAPHYIVDAQGNPVAALTEDGAPEEVKGVGGVEVVPLDPMRNALYESRKQQVDMGRAIAEKEEELQPTRKVDPNKVPMMTPDEAAQTPNVVPAEMANLQVGGFAMLPDQWIGGGQVGGMPIPTSGGPSGSRYERIGSREKMDTIMAGPAPTVGSPEYKEQRAKLLGSYFSDFGSQAVNLDVVKALNEGRAPDKLITASAFATMDAGAQEDYTAMLMERGIVRSPEHLRATQRRFAPTALR